jgi:2-polyprenyl-6-methoxyphenol hydroxylase-like FAD-dependent oxidoreductase
MGVEGSRVGIVGGSIGGCAAAIALHRAGCEVTVFERSRGQLKDRGAGIAIPVPLHDQLVGAGYLDATMPACRCSERTWVVRHGNAAYGRVIGRQRLSAVLNNWGVLWRTLRAGVPDEAYREGAGVSGVEADADGAALLFDDGRRERFDTLVGADGYRSRVRTAVNPGVHASFAGYVLWRGNYEESRLPHAPRPDAIEARFVTVGFPGGHGIFFLMPEFDRGCEPGHRRVNWAVYTGLPDGMVFDDPSSFAPGSLTPELIGFFERVLARHFPPYWADVIRRTGPEAMSLQPIYDVALPTYTSPRLVLVGDASTITRPHTASGATKALQDALALERHCLEHETWEAALEAYDADRCPVGNDLVQAGRRIGRAQVEETPDWASLTATQLEAWLQATVSGHRLYLYDTTKLEPARANG